MWVTTEEFLLDTQVSKCEIIKAQNSSEYNSVEQDPADVEIEDLEDDQNEVIEGVNARPQYKWIFQLEIEQFDLE